MRMKITVLILLILLKCHIINGEEDMSFEYIQDNFKAAEFPAEETISQLSTADIDKIKQFLRTMNRQDDPTAWIKDPIAYCRSFHTCYECVKSVRRICKWCHNFGCVESTEQLCPLVQTNSSYATGKLNPCPYIQNNAPILIPAGEKMRLKVDLFSLDPVIYDKEIICQIKLKDRLTHLKGLVLNNTVYCYPVTIERNEYDDTETGTFRLIWGGAQPFSNEIPILMYHCEYLAIECETCRMVPPEYGCGWCDEVKKCVTGDKCGNDLMKWTLNRLTCSSFGKKLYYV